MPTAQGLPDAAQLLDGIGLGLNHRDLLFVFGRCLGVLLKQAAAVPGVLDPLGKRSPCRCIDQDRGQHGSPTLNEKVDPLCHRRHDLGVIVVGN
eukprot:9280989-Pyramimonas_sp.AAC.1